MSVRSEIVRFKSGTRRVYYINCVDCGTEVKKYDKYRAENSYHRCITCFNKFKFSKEVEKVSHKICKKCNQDLPIEKFFVRKSGHHRLECIKCINLHPYKINKTDYDNLCIKQDNKCDICGDITKLVVDHCHQSGKVRSLLCTHCNAGLGNFKENIDFLYKAMDYIRKYNEN